MKKAKFIFVFVIACVMCGCAFTPNTVFLTSRDKVYFVPSNSTVPVLENGETGVIKTDTEMVLVDKGKYYSLEQEANENLLK